MSDASIIMPSKVNGWKTGSTGARGIRPVPVEVYVRPESAGKLRGQSDLIDQVCDECNASFSDKDDRILFECGIFAETVGEVRTEAEKLKTRFENLLGFKVEVKEVQENLN